MDTSSQQGDDCIQHLFQMAFHLHQMLCLKLSNAVVVVISSAGQKGVDADNPTLHVQCFVHVREATGVSMRRQGKLYRLMKMTMMKMMTIRYGTLLIIPVMRSTIKFTPIYESILWTFLI